MARKYNPRKYNPKWGYIMKTKEKKSLKADEALRSTASEESSWKGGSADTITSYSTSSIYTTHVEKKRIPGSLGAVIGRDARPSQAVFAEKVIKERKDELIFELIFKKNPTITDVLNHAINNEEPIKKKDQLKRIPDLDYETKLGLPSEAFEEITT